MEGVLFFRLKRNIAALREYFSKLAILEARRSPARLIQIGCGRPTESVRSASWLHYPPALFTRSNLFINRIFKNDLISGCLCALNHLASCAHNRVGRRLLHWESGHCWLRGQRLHVEEIHKIVGSATGRIGVLPTNRDPCVGKSSFSSWMKTLSYTINKSGPQVQVASCQDPRYKLDNKIIGPWQVTF